jgi:hypothetical protein
MPGCWSLTPGLAAPASLKVLGSARCHACLSRGSWRRRPWRCAHVVPPAMPHQCSQWQMQPAGCKLLQRPHNTRALSAGAYASSTPAAGAPSAAPCCATACCREGGGGDRGSAHPALRTSRRVRRSSSAQATHGTAPHRSRAQHRAAHLAQRVSQRPIQLRPRAQLLPQQPRLVLVPLAGLLGRELRGAGHRCLVPGRLQLLRMLRLGVRTRRDLHAPGAGGAW